ncbi:enoyl-CoA hydratase-related protein [Amycolatopsis acidiphila]|uniref:Enoyl-CoA hydratase n=1 Tax=Amycolatopsis acidiphila TaxID=715473 RepID=A0A558A688_9PSEU|nr:enoyl-CoA hydratase-related protein [Amycolatopsis acidiphila]TVT19755.1 enoyl-CoA hydratase [Amycolatopsis acidiphila]UIJ61882.1 enoyl-CoA hydratase-related protein [Amycolatopsis acidiphila]
MAVTSEVRERILIVRIEREEKRNAIDVETALGIDEALNRLDDDPELWVGVLTGTRTVFSAGTDLKNGMDARTERGGEYGIIRRKRVKPLVAAVEGVAFGGGFEIALACDLVVASRSARFALPESLRGLVATSGALFRVIRALPLHLAKELLITGAELNAERAHQFGFVNRVTEAGQALEGALAVAEEICASSPVSVRTTLAAIAAQLEEQDRKGWAETARAQETVRASADMQEGINAFFERRPPRWQGR